MMNSIPVDSILYKVTDSAVGKTNRQYKTRLYTLQGHRFYISKEYSIQQRVADCTVGRTNLLVQHQIQIHKLQHNIFI
jgi:hypothetical protein